MKLIVGLGNPGLKYSKNRHNVGFMFVEYLANKLSGSEVGAFKFDKYLESEILELPTNRLTVYPLDPKVILAKPQTYMNKSGIAVKKLLLRYSLLTTNGLLPNPNSLFIVHDDLDIPLGKAHIQVGVGPQLHNGLESIEQHLKTKEFSRIRIGVDARTRENRMEGESYVLKDFMAEEHNILIGEVFPKIAGLLKYAH